MQDKWMNIGYENDELKPYLEPIPDFNDKNRLGMIIILFILQCQLFKPIFSYDARHQKGLSI